MKSRLLKNIAGTIIIVSLIAVVAAVLQPVYRGVTDVLHKSESQFLTAFTEQTNLKINCKSISPSILTGIRINGIEICEISTGKKILEIQKAVLQFKVKSLLKQEWSDAFTNLTVTDVKLDFDMEKDSDLVLMMGGLFLSPKENSVEKEKVSDSGTSSLTDFLFPLPFPVLIKKVSVKYKDTFGTAEADFSRIQLKAGGDADSLFGTAKGILQSDIKDFGTAGVNISLEGRIIRDLSGSSLLCDLSDRKNMDYSVSKTQLLIRYDKGRFIFNSLQNLLPYSFSGIYNIKKQNVLLKVHSENLDPFTIVRLKEIPQQLQIVKGSRITCDGDITYSLATKRYQWHAKGDVELVKSILKMQENVAFDGYGNNDEIIADSLYATGEFITAGLSGSYSLSTQQPGELTVDLISYLLPNGNNVQGEIFLDTVKNGYFAFIPQLFVGDVNLTAVQLYVYPHEKSLDFTAEMNDYSHADYDDPGEIKVSGTYSYENKAYVQASVEISSLFFDSAANIVSSVVDKDTAKAVTAYNSTIEPFLFSNEIYVSTDFKSVSYNSPYMIIANTMQEKQMLLLSFDGNESSVNVSEFDLIYADQNVKARIDAELSLEEKEVFLTAETFINSIPYNLRVSYRDGQHIDITGDYELDALINLGKDVSGSVKCVSLPVAVKDMIFFVSTDSDFSYTDLNKYNVQINRFGIEEGTGKFELQPKIEFNGYVNTEGFVISSLSYADRTSSLDGSGQFLWNINNNLFETLNGELKMKNPLSEESVLFTATVSNPFGLPLESEHFLNDFYFNGELDAINLPMSRFMENQVPDDTLNAKLYASGTIKNPMLTCNLESVSMQFSGAPMYAKGTLYMENSSVTITEFNADWNSMKVHDVTGNFDIADFNGKLKCQFDMNMIDRNISIPFSIRMKNMGKSKEKVVPEYFKVTVNAEEINGNLLPDLKPFTLTYTRVPGKSLFSSDENLSLNAWIDDEGNLSATVKKNMPLSFVLNGKLDGSFMNLKCSDLQFDITKLAYLINTDSFTLHSGNLSGNFEIQGLGADPDISGDLLLSGLDVSIPDYLPDHIKNNSIKLSADTDNIIVQNTTFNIAGSTFDASAKIELDRWSFMNMEASITTNDKKGIPVDINIPLLRVKGNTGLDIKARIDENDIILTGNAQLLNSEIQALTNMDSLEENNNQSPMAMNLKMALNLTIGKNVYIIMNPLIRGLIAPQTAIDFSMNTENNIWNLKSSVVLRGGEITWLNRNFYIKEGRIDLNENQGNFNPSITLRAETREMDSEGNPVTINLNAVRQSVKKFKPTLSSIPAKSEKDIIRLLGQFATGDILTGSDTLTDVGNLLLTGLDYGLQMTMFRSLENTLRDLPIFDIVSIRMPFLQNASKKVASQEIPNFGNLLENSTVYVGKYLNNSLYLDAMLRLSNNETGEISKIVFQPEIGFELSSPFANIRWSYAPDFANLNSMVPATSITLSWKFTF